MPLSSTHGTLQVVCPGGAMQLEAMGRCGRCSSSTVYSIRPAAVAMMVFVYVLAAIVGCSSSSSQGQHQRLLGTVQTDSVRLSLVHRNSMDSPFRKTYESGLEALQDICRMDKLRLKEFEVRLESSIVHLAGSTHKKAGSREKGEMAQVRRRHHHKTVSTKVSSGASAGSGQYFVSFYIGTPAQQFFLIADTGSDLIWVRCCRKCRSSSATERFFSPKKSRTFFPIPCSSRTCHLVPHFSCNRTHHGAKACRYDYLYADLSESSGVFAHETATLNSSSGQRVRVSRVAFGCGFQNTGNSFKGSSGVLGLGRGAISFSSQIGSLVGNTFSYCFVDFFHKPPLNSFIVFGKRPAMRYLKAPFQYTSLLSNPAAAESFYYIGIEHISIDKEVLPIRRHVWQIDAEGNGGAVIDSGTTLTYFLEPAYRRIYRVFKRKMPYPRVSPRFVQPFNLCFNVSGYSHPEFPHLSIMLRGNVTLEPPPANYFIDVMDSVKCLGIQAAPSGLGFSVLGNLLQQNFLVEYNREMEQLSFAPTLCSAA